LLQFAIEAPAEAHTASDDGNAIALVRWCGRVVLSDEARDALRTLAPSLSVRDWDVVLFLARRHGLAPLVFKHLAETGLLAHVPGSVAAELRADYCATLVTSRRLEIERGRVLAALAERGIEVLLLKGVTLATRYYHEVALRPSNDLDVLVQREQARRCLRALRALGYRPLAGAGRLLDAYVLYYLELDYHHNNGVRIEPHLALARLPAYRKALAVDEVWRRALHLTIDGVPTRYLHPWDELWYLSVHYSVPHEARRLIWLVDIAELLRTHQGDWDWDWDGFVDATIERGLALPVSVTLRHARDELGVRLPPGVLERLQAAAAARREQTAWHTAHAESSNLARLGGHLLSLPGIVQKFAFIWGMVVVGGPEVMGKLGHALHVRWHNRARRRERFG
jgi:hypothetical protein